jgi:hypothetical protein
MQPAGAEEGEESVAHGQQEALRCRSDRRNGTVQQMDKAQQTSTLHFRKLDKHAPSNKSSRVSGRRSK